jgi:hypothetical protein
MLSEMLVALLERLPRSQMSDFVAHAFLPLAAVDQWRRSLAKWNRVEWLTEVSMTHGRADIVLVADGVPVLVVENKVGSGLRMHGRRGAAAADGPEMISDGETERELVRAGGELEEVRTQLHTYAEWLASKCADPSTRGWPGALVLLTHSCPPPADFSDGAPGSYKINWRRLSRWHEVAAWLLKVSDPGDSNPAPGAGTGDTRLGWIVLAREMADFLKERNMAEDRIVKSDLEWVALRMAEGESGFSERVKSTLTTVIQKIASDVPILQWDKFDGAFDEASRALWGWGYLRGEHAPPRVRSQFLTVGVCYPTDDSDWCRAVPPLPGWPHMIVALGHDPKGEFASWTEDLRTMLPAGWRTVEGGSWLHTFVAKPLYEFPSDPDDMFRELAIWGTEQVKKVEPLVRSMAKAAAQTVVER